MNLYGDRDCPDETMKETISDIIDERLDPSSVDGEFGRIAADDSHCRVWRDYHLIGDVIRGEVRTTGSCLLSRVQVALMEEPTVCIPDRRTAVGHSPESAGRGRVTTGADTSRGDALKAAGLFSLAASIALVAVITLIPQGPGSHETTVASSTTGVVPGTDVGGATDSVHTNHSFHAEFGQMLAGHGEFTGTTGLNGLLAYAKLVSNQPLGE